MQAQKISFYEIFMKSLKKKKKSFFSTVHQISHTFEKISEKGNFQSAAKKLALPPGMGTFNLRDLIDIATRKCKNI